MRYLSLFSGIEAATVAWRPLGWKSVGFAEIEPFPCAVLTHHYPDVPNLGSVTEITDEQIAALGPIDVVVGGSPCQDLSVAGRRKGIVGERSRLFHEQVRIFNAARLFCGARWLVWENVPGVFSSNQGRDFAVVAGSLAGCELNVPRDGWGTEGVALGDAGLVEWSVLDAQWFGVAQRRRRVFAVLDAGNWEDRPPILLERDGLRGDSPPSREPWEGLAKTISAGASNGGAGHDARSGDSKDVAMCLNAGAMGRQDAQSETLIPAIRDGSNPKPCDPCHPLAAGAHAPAVAFTGTLSVHGTQDPDTLVDQAHTLGRNQGQENAILSHLPSAAREVAQTITSNYGKQLDNSDTGLGPNVVLQPYTLAIRGRGDSHNLEYRQDGTANALLTPNGGRAEIGVGAIGYGASVRRLTPRECERLQGFPDDYTRIEWRGKPAHQCPDGPRYKALGNSMAVPVMRWIGQRISIAVNFTARQAHLQERRKVA